MRRDGAVAQLGERLVRNEEVRGSIPLSSTIPRLNLLYRQRFSQILSAQANNSARKSDTVEWVREVHMAVAMRFGQLT